MRKPRHTQEEVIAILSDGVKNNLSIKELAQKHHQNYQTIWHWTQRSGVVLPKTNKRKLNWMQIAQGVANNT